MSGVRSQECPSLENFEMQVDCQINEIQECLKLKENPRELGK